VLDGAKFLTKILLLGGPGLELPKNEPPKLCFPRGNGLLNRMREKVRFSNF
jgi:hypothetical protein